MSEDRGTTAVAVLQTSCEPAVLTELCEREGLEAGELVERRGLDGDPFTIAVAVVAGSTALRSLEGIVRALIERHHPIKLSLPGGGGVSGVSAEDLPAVVEALRAAERMPADEGGELRW